MVCSWIFCLTEKSDFNCENLGIVNKFKYLDHIREVLCDGDDTQRQCCKLYAQADRLARKFIK